MFFFLLNKYSSINNNNNVRLLLYQPVPSQSFTLVYTLRARSAHVNAIPLFLLNLTPSTFSSASTGEAGEDDSGDEEADPFFSSNEGEVTVESADADDGTVTAKDAAARGTSAVTDDEEVAKGSLAELGVVTIAEEVGVTGNLAAFALAMAGEMGATIGDVVAFAAIAGDIGAVAVGDLTVLADVVVVEDEEVPVPGARVSELDVEGEVNSVLCEAVPPVPVIAPSGGF